MEKELKLKTHWKSQVTTIHLGTDFALTKRLPEILEENKLKTAVITDTNVEKLFGKEFEHLDVKIFSFPSGEISKTRDTKIMLEDHLLSHNFGRDSLIVGLGGGVVNDVAGFLASTYCRGVGLIQIPTTLLGMVDASIGGKNGVNTPYGKNMIGTFYPPKEVLIDGHFLMTLPEKQKKNGIAEILKAGLIASPRLFHAMQNSPEKWEETDLEFIMDQIEESLSIKKEIVEKDPEEEKGIRRILNLGHTFGHVLENLEHYEIEHGEAISVGILASCYISVKMDLLTQKEFDEIRNIFELYHIPLKIPNRHSIDDWMGTLARDKKAKKGSPRMVLIEKIGLAAPFDGDYCVEVDFPLLEETINWIYQEFYG